MVGSVFRSTGQEDKPSPSIRYKLTVFSILPNKFEEISLKKIRQEKYISLYLLKNIDKYVGPLTVLPQKII